MLIFDSNIFNSYRVFILKDSHRVGEVNPMNPDIFPGLGRVPFNFHSLNCMYIRNFVKELVYVHQDPSQAALNSYDP